MLDIRTAGSCSDCGAIWARDATTPNAMLCESVELDRVVAWVCLACHSWWRLSNTTLDRYPDAELARLANLDLCKLRGTCHLD